MLEWFTEDSIVPLVLGTILTVVFFVFWVISRDGWMAKIAFFILLLTMGTVVCESLIVTDREKVTDIVYELAQFVQNNDPERIIERIHGGRLAEIERVRREMPRYNFLNCQVLGVKSFELSENKKNATIVFMATARAQRDPFPDRHFVRAEVELKFEKHVDDWLMVDHRVEIR